MRRSFNVTGACHPQFHYMVDIHDRLEKIKTLIDEGAYFTMNRARQYGKTTTLECLKDYLKQEYAVIYLDFQMLSKSDFQDEKAFVNAFSDIFVSAVKMNPDMFAIMPKTQFDMFETAATFGNMGGLRRLFVQLSELCGHASKPLVLLIDEVDSAANNQVFLDFLAQLRGYYLARYNKPTFQSVILASVYDVKNIRQKIRPDDVHHYNSPWNTREGNEENGCLHSFDDCPRDHREFIPYDIAADFDVVMSFSEDGIAGMLKCYEADYRTGMDVTEMARLIMAYTSGYPFLVSRICKLLDEKIAGSDAFPDAKAAWTQEGLLEAVKILMYEKNTLFESLMGKVQDYPDLKKKLYAILFGGEKIIYNPDDPSIDMASMFGFIKNEDGNVVVANRIFEIRLYNYFLTIDHAQDSEIFKCGAEYKSQVIKNGHLNMELLLKRYIEHFDSIYGDGYDAFDEDEGRRRFLLYLRPIINGTGNYYIEAETRNSRRMDIVVDYLGEQFIIELKIWRGNAYHERGEKQLSDYLEYYHLKKGYMLSYCFNKKKKIGINEIMIGDRTLIEAIV